MSTRTRVRGSGIFSADGTEVLGRLVHGESFRITDAGDGWVLGVWKGEMDVESVRIYPVVTGRGDP